jgi:hypothetical protein
LPFGVIAMKSGSPPAVTGGPGVFVAMVIGITVWALAALAALAA